MTATRIDPFRLPGGARTGLPASNDVRLRRLGALLLPFVSLVLIHMLSGMQMEQPLVLADELGYLGNARYLSGSAHLPDMWRAQFYHFGYSLFLFPAFWLFTEPISTYKAAIFINALLASSLYFPLCFILTSLVQLPTKMARWIAFGCCLYPSVILYSNFAWSENAYVPLYAAAAALFGKYLASRSPRDAFFFSLVAGFLYTIHPRALPVFAAILAYILLLAILRTMPMSQLLLCAGTMGAIFVATRLINAHLRATGWGGGGAFSATRLSGRIVPDADFPALIERAVGQVLYLSQASHGLFMFGLIAMIWLIVRGFTSGSIRQVLSDPTTGVSVFVLTTGFGVLAASCTVKLYSLHGREGIRGADFIHGRYNEAFAVVLIAFALAELCRTGLSNPQLIRRSIVVVAVILCLTVVVMIEVDDALGRHAAERPGVEPNDEILPSGVNTLGVPGVKPLVEMIGALNLYAMSFAVISSFLMITLMSRISQRGAVVLLISLFCFFSYHNFRHYLLPANAKFRPRLAFTSYVRDLGPIAEISYDTAHLEPHFVPGIQFLLPDTVFNRFDSRKDHEPQSEAVISEANWAQAERFGARYVLSSGTGSSALWFLPGPLQSRLPVDSYDGMILGVEAVVGVQESGFHPQESIDGRPARWTNGAATLTVPLEPEAHPHVLGIEVIAIGRDDVDLQVVANGIELWNQPIPAGNWSRSFSLDQVPINRKLRIDLNSDSFSPGNRSDGPADLRRLGVVVRGIRLAEHARLAAEASTGMKFGTQPIFGFLESGFHRQESFGDAPGRWTDGMASLRIPLDPHHPPDTLGIQTVAPGRDGADLQVLANGIVLWNQPVPPEPWSMTFNLDHVPLGDELFLELSSDTFSPGLNPDGSRDQRQLGVAVTGIQLSARERLAAEIRAGLRLGAEPTFGVEESGFYRQESFGNAPGRWTNGMASLRIPLDPDYPPDTLEIETIAPGRDGAILRVVANGIELWHQTIPPDPRSISLSLETVPLDDALLVELESDTFSPGLNPGGASDQRRLGVVVRGVRLRAPDCTDH